MTTSTVDVDAYVERIAYGGSLGVSVETLAGIHLHHAMAIPFENLNPFLRWPVRLDVQSLEQKLVRDGRGGYCFGQNLLLKHVLARLGFRVKGLAARVLWNVPEGRVTPRGHMLLLIDLAGHEFVADVGFGGCTLTGPILLEVDVEQTTPHEPFRVLRSGDAYLMQAKIGAIWQSLYQFDLQEQFLADYEVTSWYLSNNPTSHFVTGLIAARPDRHRRYALRGHELTVHHRGGRTERRTLASVEAIRSALADTFRLRLPDRAELEPALERVVAGADRQIASLTPPDLESLQSPDLRRKMIAAGE
jgi:N-hydroxyarylamine O-acetyltransferase